MPENIKLIMIYTDGGYRPSLDAGGWGVVMLCDAHRRGFYGGKLRTTNNQMELMAAINGLRAVKDSALAKNRYRVVLHTDSKYVVDGITKWLAGWRRNNWYTTAGHPVANMDLWEELEKEMKRTGAEAKWVKGHATGNSRDAVYNRAADTLAASGLQAAVKAGFGVSIGQVEVAESDLPPD